MSSREDAAGYSSYQNTGETESLLINTQDTLTNSDISLSTELKISDAINAIGAFRLKQKQQNYKLVTVMEIFANGESGHKTTKSLTELLEYVQNEVVRISGNAVDPAGSTARKTLHVRVNDLLHLVHDVRNEEPILLIRRHAVIVNFYPIRAIVLADKLIMVIPKFVEEEMTQLLQEIMNDLADKYQEVKRAGGEGFSSSSGSFGAESRFYATIFSTIIALHEQEYLHIKAKVSEALAIYNYVNAPITVESQEYFRHLKNTIANILVKVSSYRAMLSAFMADEGNLALLNLSVLRSDSGLYTKPLAEGITKYADESMVVVENCHMDYNTLYTKLESVRSQIQFTEEMLFFRLDTQRNELLEGEIVVAVVMAVLGVVTFITSAFGMNIYSGIEEIDKAFFWTLLAVLVLIAVLGSYFSLLYFKRFGLFQRSPTALFVVKK